MLSKLNLSNILKNIYNKYYDVTNFITCNLEKMYELLVKLLVVHYYKSTISEGKYSEYLHEYIRSIYLILFGLIYIEILSDWRGDEFKNMITIRVLYFIKISLVTRSEYPTSLYINDITFNVKPKIYDLKKSKGE